MTGALLACGLLVSTASANNAGLTHYPDLQTIIPTDTFSVVQGAAGKEFRYTHLVYNQGPGRWTSCRSTTRRPAATPAAQVAGASSFSAATAEAKKVAAATTTSTTVRTSSAAHLKYCRLTGTTRRFS
jgi:hypothetical protein